MTTFSLGQHPHVDLCDLIKLEGWAGSGAMAKSLIASGYVMVDGNIETRKRCKILIGQTVVFKSNQVTIVK